MKNRQYNRRFIKAAQDIEDTRIKDMGSLIKDDFEYLLDSFDKLDRMGKVNEALDIMNILDENINQCIQDCVDQIAN